MSNSMLVIYTDGGSRSNPGPAGAGVWIKDNKTSEEKSLAVFLGKKTNNEAEYLGLIIALRWLSGLEDGEVQANSQVEIYLDSKLVVEQVNKNWKIKQPHLQKLANQAWQLIKPLPYSIKISHVKRDQNKQADELANLAMDLGSNLT